jgi:hypothetical protein
MIKINNRYYINANSNCYTLQEKTKIQDKESKNYGKEIYKDLGYYVTIESLLNGVLKKETREYISKDEENSLKDLKQFIDEKYKYLKSLNLDKLEE